MQVIRDQAAFAKYHGLFRAASGVDVTWNLLSWTLPNGGHGTSGSRFRFTSLRKVSSVDLFISHSSACPSWLKYLAVSHYLNLDGAIFLYLIACLLMVLILVARAGWSIPDVAHQPQGVLFGCLFSWPMLVFVLANMGGTLFSNRTFWLDRICIDQENLLLKSQALKAVPAFVANADQLVLLLDETYFGRLWCIYELAVHTKAGLGVAELVPTWMPIITIYFICFQVVLGSVSISLGNALPQMDTESRRSLFMSVLNYSFFPLIYYPSVGLGISWLFFQKLKHHKSMLDRMSKFDLRNAKCTLETDRRVIEEQVLSLFDEALEPAISVAFDTEIDTETEAEAATALLPEMLREIRHITSYPTNDQIIDQFNAYVRGPLRDNVVKSLGKEDYISVKLCMIAALPLAGIALVYLLGCDGHADCETSASYAGFSSVSQYMWTNCIWWLFVAPLGQILEIPPQLITCNWVMELVPDGKLRLISGTCLCAIVLYLCDCIMLTQRAILTVTMAKFSPLWLGALVISVLLDFWLVWFLFFRKLHPSTSQTQRALVR